MTERIDMSLDDIIKSNKASRGRGSGRGKGRAGRGGGGRGGAVRGRSRSRSRVAPGGGDQRNGRSRSRGPANAGRSRSRSRVRNGPAPRRGGGMARGRGVAVNRRGRSRSRSAVRRDVRNMNDQWQHDRFTGRPGITSAGPGKLVVSNLDFGVTETDIHELFSEFGRLKGATIHYDIQGRSLGTADVIYDRRSDAIKAMKQYDGVPLDGRAMKIELTSDVNSLMNSGPRPRSASVSRRRVQSQGRITKRGGAGNARGRGGRRGGARRGISGGRAAARSVGGGRGRARAGRRGGPKRGGGAKKGPAPNKDQLDKELDSFMKER
eukprot:TRINITY_DN24744_c0_g1_i1.p2 TRINITY_DN24744_c0_g1~~TRINITY_DN24744_c0_g1_i1.p2  ORF type:complete len:322 (-),score=61.59 TRINITY_DN24744_c0_g1_i1:166-1131(-)